MGLFLLTSYLKSFNRFPFLALFTGIFLLKASTLEAAWAVGLAGGAITMLVLAVLGDRD